MANGKVNEFGQPITVKQITLLDAVSVAAGATSPEINFKMGGYKQALIFVKADQSYDILYRLGDGVNQTFNVTLNTAQAATGSNFRSHQLASGSMYLFAENVSVSVKNNGSAGANITVSAYLVA